MKKIHLFLLLFCLTLLQSNAQNQPSPQKEKMEEFRVLFVQNAQLQSGRLSNYKNINYAIDTCAIEIKTIDYENSKDENVTIEFPTSGAILKENGELYYKNKAIKETIENKITKKNTVNLYNNSKKIGLLLKFDNKEKHNEFQEKLNKISGYCKLEKNN